MLNVRDGIRVKNTFIEVVDDGPDDDDDDEQPAAGRNQSAPAKIQPPAKSNSSLLDDEDDVDQLPFKREVQETYERGTEWDWAPIKDDAALDAADPLEAYGEQPRISQKMTPDPFEEPSMLGAAYPAFTLPDRGYWPVTPQGRPPQLQDISDLGADEYANRIKWGVDAGKLEGDDKKLMSPTFDVTTKEGYVAKFKMMLHATKMSDGRMTSFRQAGGRGKIAMKFMARRSELPPTEALTIALRISVGGVSRPKDGVVHDFLDNPEYTLPAEIEEWEFGSLVNQKRSKLIVCIELLVQ